MRIASWFYTVPLRLRSLFRRRRVETDLQEELRYHLECKAEEFAAEGLPPQESRRAALRAMDGLTQRAEQCRDTWHMNAIDNLVRDVRYGVRILARSPAFTALAVATLALAIGANAVVFGVLNALVIRPLNVPRSESLYGLQRPVLYGFQSYPDYLDLRDRNRTFESLIAYTITQAGLDEGASPSRVWVEPASGNYFDGLGIQPYLGRFFHASDEHGPNSAPYVVLSYAYWHNHFADDRGVIGRVVRLNKHPFTVIGVAPPDFHGTLLFFFPDLFIPMVNEPQIDADYLNARGYRWIMQVIGHLKPRVTPARAAADINSIGGYLERTYPATDTRMTFTLGRPWLYGDFFGGPTKAFVTALMVLAALILLAACANLGSLFAARAADRGREVALRLALGATGGRILRGLFTEAILISLLGGALGLLGSVWLLGQLSVWQPISRLPITVPVQPDANVYAVALFLAVASGILFGLVPVRQVLGTDPYQIVKAGPGIRAGRRFTARDLLLVVQIAICAVLVTSSMVAARGLARSLYGKFGFEPRNVVIVETDLKMAGYSEAQAPAMQKRIIEALAVIPGVEAAAFSDNVPLSMGGNRKTVFNDKVADLRASNAAGLAYRYKVSPGYLEAAGTALLAGRSFDWHDDRKAPDVAVVNREFAARVLGTRAAAVGSYFKLGDGSRIRVIGMVEDGKYLNLAEDPQPAMFVPILQLPASETVLVVRSKRDPGQLAAAIKPVLRSLDPALPFSMQTWDKALAGVLFPMRVAAVALGVLGLMGALLAITGIFGMAAYSVSKRQRELGIRVALGAQRGELLQAALGRALKLLACGSAAGLVLGVLASRVLAAIVYQATPRDPLVLAGVVLAMTLVGALATWIPAQRALSLDPVALLREE